MFSKTLCIKTVLTNIYIFQKEKKKIHITFQLIIPIHTNQALYLPVDSIVFSFLLFSFFSSAFVACGSKVYGFLSFLEPTSKVATQPSFKSLQIVKKQNRHNTWCSQENWDMKASVLWWTYTKSVGTRLSCLVGLGMHYDSVLLLQLSGISQYILLHIPQIISLQWNLTCPLIWTEPHIFGHSDLHPEFKYRFHSMVSMKLCRIFLGLGSLQALYEKLWLLKLGGFATAFRIPCCCFLAMASDDRLFLVSFLVSLPDTG